MLLLKILLQAGVDPDTLKDSGGDTYNFGKTIDAYQIIQNGVEVQQKISQAMDDTWLDVFGSSTSPPSDLYISIVRFALIFAVLGLAWHTVQILQAFLEDELLGFGKILFPLILVVFLSNDGFLLRNFTLGMRTLINGITLTVLDNVAQQSLTQAYQLAQQKVGTIQFLSDQLEICANIVDSTNTDAGNGTVTGNEQVDCIMQVYQQAEALGLQGESWFDSTLGKIGEMIADPSKIVTDPLSSFFNGGASLILNILLTTLGVAFQWLIELSLIFVGILGGLVGGVALLPGQQKAVVTWISGMASLGLIKLGYNIMLGMTGLLMYKSESNDPLLMPLVVGLLAPVMSLAIGALSFTSLITFASGLASSGLGAAGQLAARAATPYTSAAAGAVGSGIGKAAGWVGGRLDKAENFLVSSWKRIRR